MSSSIQEKSCGVKRLDAELGKGVDNFHSLR
jgi:hypothetical protein